MYRSQLVGDELCYLLNLGSIHKGTLHTHRIGAVEIEHITASDKLLRPRTVEDDAGIHHGTDTEGNTAREVRLDVTGNDAGGRSLCRNDHVDADGTCQLGYAGDRHLHFLSGSKYQVAELVDDNDNVWHELMSVFRVQFMAEELLVILLYVSYSGCLQPVVTLVHEHAQAFQRLHDFLYIRDDRLVLVLFDSCHEWFCNRGIDTELNLLRVDKYNLEFIGVFLVEQGCDDGVQSDGLTLTCGTGNKQVGNLGKVYHIDLVGDSLAQCYRQFHR